MQRQSWTVFIAQYCCLWSLVTFHAYSSHSNPIWSYCLMSIHYNIVSFSYVKIMPLVMSLVLYYTVAMNIWLLKAYISFMGQQKIHWQVKLKPMLTGVRSSCADMVGGGGCFQYKDSISSSTEHRKGLVLQFFGLCKPWLWKVNKQTHHLWLDISETCFS